MVTHNCIHILPHPFFTHHSLQTHVEKKNKKQKKNKKTPPLEGRKGRGGRELLKKVLGFKKKKPYRERLGTSYWANILLGN